MTERLKEHWFWPLALALVAVAWALAARLPSQDLAGWEVAVLFDAFITLPLLYLICYRKKLTRNAMIGRIIALQCLGIWAATKIVPVDQQVWLLQLSWLRYCGLAVLVFIELRLIVALFRIVFKPETTSQQLEDVGMPPFLANLALLEARFWRWAFSIFKR